MNIVIPDPIDIPEEYKTKIRELGAQIYDDMPANTAALIERIKDAEVVTANYVDLTQEAIDAARKLRYIVVPAVGYEWIEVATARKRGIKVLNCPTFNSEAVAEHAVALIMAASRKLLVAAESLKRGEWEHVPFDGIELRGKMLGLIGYGNVGIRIESFIAGFGMQVTHVNSTSTQGEVDTLLKESDVVCVCVPLNTNTRHLLDQRQLSLLKKEAILVNVGRGAVIDQKALVAALRSGQFRGAGLDVFEGEPLTGSPNEEIVDLANMANVVATPHIAYYTDLTKPRMGQELYDTIRSCTTGEPIHVVA